MFENSVIQGFGESFTHVEYATLSLLSAFINIFSNLLANVAFSFDLSRACVLTV